MNIYIDVSYRVKLRRGNGPRNVVDSVGRFCWQISGDLECRVSLYKSGMLTEYCCDRSVRRIGSSDWLGDQFQRSFTYSRVIPNLTCNCVYSLQRFRSYVNDYQHADVYANLNT